MIAFVGSAFSPYYRSALAQGRGDPVNHCALNVALYGGKRRWTMTERSKRSIAREADRFVIGPSELHWDGTALTIDICEIGVPVPFPVRGRVRVHPGSLSALHVPLDDASRHRWGPIAPCARVEVELDSPSLRWQGHAYLDSNEGDEPIAQAFREWDWSRATLPDGSTAVIYDVQQKTGPDRLIGLRFFKDGHVEPFDPPPRQPMKKTGWRIDRRMRSDAGSTVRVIDMLEDTPFYERSVLASSLFGQQVISMHETLNVPRLSSGIVQRMLPFRMPRFG